MICLGAWPGWTRNCSSFCKPGSFCKWSREFSDGLERRWTVRHLRLGGKIGLVIAVQIVTMLALVLINFRQVHLLYERMHQTYSSTIPKGGLALRIRAALLDSIRKIDNAVFSDKDQESQAYVETSGKAIEDIRQMRKEWGELIEADSTSQETSLLDEFNRHWDDFLRVHNQLAEL